ncbi:hypothetical protein M0812_00715 [Anaeramoeba flamelloides]|uniref:Uncharacterized protein n=1 Tax=Anaeramoeba flamelloides TaxID=1746091 RepID=A0AAV8A5Y9_9EUKA|nr:hypothetical protein M0812_00715 [Anaeramoeba flamelloides]
MSFVWKWIFSKKENNNDEVEVPNEVVEVIQKAKKDIKEIFDEEVILTNENFEEENEPETLDLEKRRQRKIEKFRETEDSNENQNEPNNERRTRFISVKEFQEKKDTQEFEREIHSLSKIKKNKSSIKNKNSDDEDDDQFKEF